MKPRSIVKPAAAALLVGLLVTCHETPLEPRGSLPTQHPLAPAFSLVLDDTTALGALLADTTITFPDTGIVTGTTDLWAPGAMSGPVLIEVSGEVLIEGGKHLPVREVLDPGALAYYHSDGELFVRFAGVAFFRTDAGGSRTLLPLPPELGSVTSDTFRFLDTDAASGGGRLIWEFDPAQDGGINANNPGGGCLGLLISFLCYVVPFDTSRVSDVPPHGQITVRVYGRRAVTIKIDTLYGPLDSGSFTARQNENLVTLKARVTPDSLAPLVRWKVDVADSSFAQTPLPSDSLSGVTTTFTVDMPDSPRTRWPANHPGALAEKRLGFRVQAEVTTNGQTYKSAPRTLEQIERDVLREEYVEFGARRTPRSQDIRRDSTTHFSGSELHVNTDYTVWWADSALLRGIETVRSLVDSNLAATHHTFSALNVNSVFRNPVHHYVHKGYTNISYHVFGLAVDFRIDDQAIPAEQFFALLQTIAHDTTVSACFEPHDDIIKSSPTLSLDHAHLQWSSCPKGW